jgi:hypothetical protein
MSVGRALAAGLFAALCVGGGVAQASGGGDVRVTVGSPPSPFPQNKQNEPAVAVDPVNPAIAVAGANDELDLQPCPAVAGGGCPFTTGVGVSGVYFSFDGGGSWLQPTYSGWTARDCTPTSCTPHVGAIGTLPWYYEAGLMSDGDPSVAFGPRLRSGRFSWGDGARLYYANLTANFSAVRSEQAFKGFEAIAVSRTDHPRSAASGHKTAWMRPVIVSRQNAALFSDKEDIWADNAASSPFFGNVYLCNMAFRGQEFSPNAAPEPVMFTRSTNGGATWSGQRQLSAAANNITGNGRQGCEVRTDSRGTVYVVWEGGKNGHSEMFVARSFDGGKTFTRPQAVASVVDVGVFDPVISDVFFDGIAGARTDSYPSIDVANGAPSGSHASNEIVISWADARNGLNHETARLAYSTNRGTSWHQIANTAQAGDRPDFPAVAMSPTGRDLYLTYDGFLTPYQQTLAQPRWFQGVVRHADVTASGAPVGWTTIHRGARGDARGSSANSLVEEFLGDYNDAAASNQFAIAVWNDARNAADCAAVDAYRASLYTATPGTAPSPTTSCPGRFGNTDIYGGHYKAPTP